MVVPDGGGDWIGEEQVRSETAIYGGNSGGGDWSFSEKSSDLFKRLEEIQKQSETEKTAAICGGDLGTGASASKEEKTVDMIPITVKEEAEEESVLGNDVITIRSSSSSSSAVLVRPMQGLNEAGPPPFLRKLYEMVDDPVYNSIVSWSKSNNSFIVWDEHLLSQNLLPKFFKHNNFSSFIRQLNTYGFRKIDSDRGEYANAMFRRGEQDLLKGIKRRSKYTKHQGGEFISAGSAESTNVHLETEVKDLKRDQSSLQQEILKLREKQEESLHQMRSVEERIRFAERRQLQMFSFFGKIVKYPSFVQQLIQRKKQQREVEGSEFSKRRKLLDGRGKQIRQQLETMQPELTKFSTDGMEEVSVMERACSGPLDEEFQRFGPDHPQDMTSVYNVMSQSLMESKNEEEELTVNDSKIYLELEDLIGKPCGWGEGNNGHVEQSGCVGSIP